MPNAMPKTAMTGACTPTMGTMMQPSAPMPMPTAAPAASLPDDSPATSPMTPYKSANCTMTAMLPAVYATTP